MPCEPLPVADFETFCAFAREQNEYVPPERVRNAAAAPSDAKGDRPGDDFNRRATWADILTRHGWAVAGTSGEVTYWRRPGKGPREGHSATTGRCKSDLRGDLFYNFSANADPFEMEAAYDKFAAYAVLEHAGDFSAAARKLRAEGYGRPPAAENVRLEQLQDSVPPKETGSPEPNPHRPPDDRLFYWMSELRRRSVSDKWLWRGYLNRGGITLLSALWKVGKTTLLSHLIRAFDGSQETFCGQAITPGRVLYVSEEDQDTWAERRDALGIGDHVGMVCRPFTGRATPGQWLNLIASIRKEIETHKFDVVVFDTLAKLWPVREENDAIQVDDALMPVWKLSDTGAGVLLVHHLRKSDGAEYTGSRGSGALSAFVETLLELRRFDPRNKKDTRRVISATGRYQETLEELVINLTPEGYVGCGDRDSIRTADIRAAIQGCLPSDEPGLTEDELKDELKKVNNGEGFRAEDVKAELERGQQGDWEPHGVCRRSGTGKKGSPFRYWLE